MPPIALAIATSTVTVVNGTFQIILSCIRLLEVDEDLKICLKVLATANRDLNYARKLRSDKSIQGNQDRHSRESKHFENVIDEMEEAMLALGKLIRAYRVDKEVNNSISVAHRFKWVFKAKDRLAAQQVRLSMAHNSLLTVIQVMSRQQDAVPPSYESTKSSTDLPLLMSPSQQRWLQGKSTAIVEIESWPIRVPSTQSAYICNSNP